MECSSSFCIIDDFKRQLTKKIEKDLANTITYCKTLKVCVADVMGCFKQARYQFLMDKFQGKEPMTPVILDVLQRYDDDYVSNYIASFDYTVNEKALVIVNSFGDTFKGLCQFVYHMLTEKWKLSTELQTELAKLQNALFRTVIFLERFRDMLHEKRDFESIFSLKKVSEFDSSITVVLPHLKPTTIKEYRNWYIIEQIFVASDNVVEFVNPLLVTFSLSCL